MNMTEELKPCPFCGTAPRVPDYDRDSCGCDNMRCPLFRSMMLIEDWNTRATPAPAAADECPVPIMARTGWQDRDGNLIYTLIHPHQSGAPAQRGGFTEDEAQAIIAACETANAKTAPVAVSDEMVERAYQHLKATVGKNTSDMRMNSVGLVLFTISDVRAAIQAALEAYESAREVQP